MGVGVTQNTISVYLSFPILSERQPFCSGSDYQDAHETWVSPCRSVWLLTECGPASPGSVPSTRPGVGLSALSDRRRSTGARVPFSHDTVGLWAPPSITAIYGRDTHLAGQTESCGTKGQQLHNWDYDYKSSWLWCIIIMGARVIKMLWSDFKLSYFLRNLNPTLVATSNG